MTVAYTLPRCIASQLQHVPKTLTLAFQHHLFRTQQLGYLNSFTSLESSRSFKNLSSTRSNRYSADPLPLLLCDYTYTYLPRFLLSPLKLQLTLHLY